MSSYSNSYLTLYHKPIYYQKEDDILHAAFWLTSTGQFKSVKYAFQFLHYLQHEEVWNFKTIMGNFYNATSMQHTFNKYKNIDNYVTSNKNTYGDEAHMYFHLR